MIDGTVKWFNEQKGYGFVTSGGKDYFIHFKEIDMAGFKTLKEGDKVSFEPKTSPKGAVASRLIIG
ncbi:MAG TPA: cold shock domain-containing protein [Rummeliibacillus sp.]|nr:cold shock domain-containing protein [Rummeliibacillus sp.]